jgi:hypothetical protein
MTASAPAEQMSILEMASPRLRTLLNAQPVLLRELTNSLATTFAHKRIRLFYFYSNASETRSFHMYPDTSTIFIYIPQDLVPLDEYLLLLYESINATHESDFVSVYQKASAGKIGRSDFAREILKVEFETVLQVRKKLRGFALDTENSLYYDRFKKCPDNFEDFLLDVKKPSAKGDVFSFYERQYDSLIESGKEGDGSKSSTGIEAGSRTK